MDTGEFLTRATIWIAMLGYAVGSVVFAVSRGRPRLDSATRIIWTVACVGLVGHFFTVFHFYHGWSHTAAYLDTARQTEELFGLNWGGGLFVNYALLVAWILDLVWWWRSGLDSYRKRPWLVLVLWHGFFIFIIFNATVVFADGVVRWVGLVLSVSLILTWQRILTRRLKSHES